MNTPSETNSNPTNEQKQETKTEQVESKSKCGCGYRMVDCLGCDNIKPLRRN
jgi:hypothetical protein